MNLDQFALWAANPTSPLIWPFHWVDSSWHPIKKTGITKSSLNPNSGKVLLEIPCDRESTLHALQVAYSQRERFAKTKLESRIEGLSKFRSILVDYQDLVERILRLECGKPNWEAKVDFESSIRYLDFCISQGDKVLESLKSPVKFHPFVERTENTYSERPVIDLKFYPLGVAAGYLPFSTPLTTLIFYLCATQVAGCPLIVYSSSHAMVFSLLMGLLIERSQNDQLSLSILFNNFNGFKQILGDKRIAAVLYVGSREHCDVIRVESRHFVGRQLILQSGGKNASIVDESADLSLAMRSIIEGTLTSAGQRCTSTSRVFVHKNLSSTLCESLVESFRSIKIGRTDLATPDKDSPFMGPLYSQKALDKYLRFQTMAHRESSKTLLWGKAIENTEGFFVSPRAHILSKFDNLSAYQGNVLFSPDIAIYEFETLDQAISQINTTDASFAVSYIGDPAIISEIRQNFLASNLVINGSTIETSATLPLAGRLQSGHHRYHGPGATFYLCYPQILYHGSLISEHKPT